MPGKLSDEEKEALENDAKEKSMDYDTYRGNREVLEKRMEKDDETIHEMEREIDNDHKYGDWQSENLHKNRMKAAEEDFQKSSDEMKQLDDRWNEQNKDKEQEYNR